LSFAEMMTCSPQTESKGNFCLITVYGHKNFRQPQNTHARKQTFSNLQSELGTENDEQHPLLITHHSSLSTSFIPTQSFRINIA
jgi:hypothetical protein